MGIISDFDFNIKEQSYKTDEFDSSCLTLEIYGKDVNYAIMNSLRKACIDQIPIYALHRSKIKILRNSSVFDGTDMEVRLSQLPIKRVAHNVNLLPLKYYKNVNFADPKLERHPDDTINIEYYLNIKNNGPEKTLYVTTDDLRISINNNIVENNKIYQGKEKITLIQLCPGEEFECSMKGVLAVGELDAIFNASNSYYDEITENKYIFNIESNGQFTEYQLLEKGICIIIEKLKIIKENILQDQYSMILTENNSVRIEIKNEDYTCGGPINYILQDMKEKVIYSGISRPNFLEKNIALTFCVNKNYKSIDVLTEAIDTAIKLYENIKKKVNILSKGK
jgi:DNA-directed RNA polymerase subunit L